MAKNESFHKEYTITIKGISTNGFVPDMLENFLTGFVDQINKMYQQTDATIESKDLKVKPRVKRIS